MDNIQAEKENYSLGVFSIKYHFHVINLQYSTILSRLHEVVEVHKEHFRVKISWPVGSTLLHVIEATVEN